MADRPFMQLYGSDLVGDTLHLSAEQIGAYMLLLIAMWNAGGALPANDTKLARIARCTPARWIKISADLLELFEADDEKIWHKRVQKEIEKMNEKRAKNARSGSLGGTARALKHNNPPQANATKTLKRNPSIARATPEPEPDSGLHPERDSSSQPSAARLWWDEFWDMFPNKVGKADAVKAFDKARKRVDQPTMIAGLQRYVAKTDDRPWCNPSTWLNQDRWADQPAQQPQRQQTTRQPTAADVGRAYIERLEENEREDARRADHQTPRQLAAPR